MCLARTVPRPPRSPGAPRSAIAPFAAAGCRRIFNERAGTSFNHLHVPTDVVLLVVVGRLRYKLSLRDLAEMFLARGFVFTHERV